MPPGRPTRAEPEASQSRTAKGGAGRFAGWRGPGRVAKPRTQAGAGASPPECAASGPPAGESMDAQTLRQDATGAPAAARSPRANKLGAGGRETAEKTLVLRTCVT